jgi:tetratricopeptide (TPR) repeat protein
MAFISFLMVSMLPGQAFAETKTFTREYSYQATAKDDKNSSRIIALREVKQILLDDLGEYLLNETSVKDVQIPKERIAALAAGIVPTQLVEEKWDEKVYSLQAKITADPDHLISFMDALGKDVQKTTELEEVKKLNDDLLNENKKLREEPAAADVKKQPKTLEAYHKTIKELDSVEWFEKGYATAASGNFSDAVTAYTKAVENNPQFAAAYRNRGIAYTNLGKHNQAIGDYNKAIKINPKQAVAYNNRGTAYGNLGKFSQAIPDFNKAIQLYPQDAEAHYNRGLSYEQLGNYHQAIKNYNKSIEINPKHANAYHNLGVAYYKLGNFNQAIVSFNEAIKINPQDAETHYNKGLSYLSLENYQQAIVDFNEAIKINPELADAYFKRGIALANVGEKEKAFDDVTTSAKLGHKKAQEILKKRKSNGKSFGFKKRSRDRLATLNATGLTEQTFSMQITEAEGSETAGK